MSKMPLSVVASLVALCVTAKDARGQTSEVAGAIHLKAGEVKWARIPKGSDLVRAFPKNAIREEISGRAVMTCEITPSGSLKDCVLAEEVPVGEGFGEGALRVASGFQAEVAAPIGGPLPVTVDVLVVFQVKGFSLFKRKEPARPSPAE